MDHASKLLTAANPPKNGWMKEWETDTRLAYLLPPAYKNGNCLFNAMGDQLVRLGRVSRSATKLNSDLVNYLRSNPATPDGTHFSEFINLGAWDTYLRRMAMDGERGDWIALWGLILTCFKCQA